MFEHRAAGVEAHATLPTMDAREPDFEFLNESPPFSKGEIDRLGQFYAGRRADPPDKAAEVLEWHNRLASSSEAAIATFIASKLEWPPQVNGMRTASRVKSADTIASKVRDRNIQLSRVQDFVGTRFTWNCLHSELRTVGESLAHHLQSLGFHVELKDYLDAPQQGYRGVHLWLRTPAGRIEIQLRTLLQSVWANAYERAGDIAGRRIRYEAGYRPDDPWLSELVDQLIQLSADIYAQEKAEEKALGETEELLLRISRQPKVLPIAPETHRARAQMFSHLSRSEEANATRAASYLELLRSLDTLAASLETYGRASIEKDDRDA